MLTYQQCSKFKCWHVFKAKEIIYQDVRKKAEKGNISIKT